jgi:two-component system nitrate/nitrite response regulator NarL
MPTIKIALIDDHQIVLDGLKAMLATDKRFEIVASTTHPQELLQVLPFINADILITDMLMPEMSGLELAKKARAIIGEALKIVALSMSKDLPQLRNVVETIQLSGYILKTISKEDFIFALSSIAAGERYFSDSVYEYLYNTPTKEREQLLTRREMEIVELIAKEFNNKQIAEKLFISERTVETHRKNIYRKTNTHTVIGLLQYLRSQRIIA